MQFMAAWGPKGFLVSPTKLVPLQNLATSLKLKADANGEAGGSAPTNERGRELQSVTLSTAYHAMAGVDPRGQLEEWEGLLGKVYPLLIGGKVFGPKNLQLQGVDISDVQLTASGEMLSVAVGLTLAEYAPATKTNAGTKKTASGSKPGTVALTKAEAMSATASAQDKAERKG